MPTVSVTVNSSSSGSGSGSGSTSDDTSKSASQSTAQESSSATSSEADPNDDTMRRADLVARLDEMRRDLEGARADIKDAADDLMPAATHCGTLTDVMVAWNDALGSLLADARTACDDARLEARTAEESDEEAAGDDFRMYGDEGFMLHIDAEPVDFSNLDTEYAEARSRCEAFGAECREQLEAAVASHDLLVECLDKELDMAKQKCTTDVRSIQYGVRQLQDAAAATLQEQQSELAEQQAMLADFRARMPPPSLLTEAAELRSTLARMPDAIPDKAMWLAQLASGATDKEVVAIVAAAQRAAQPLQPDVWARLAAAAEDPETPPPERARNVEALERSVVAMEVPDDVREGLEDLRGAVRLALARRQQQRSEVAMGISVATREFSHRLAELFNEYCALHMRILDVVRDLLHTTQSQWQAAVSALQSDCFAPLQELGLPFAKATMGTRCLVAYQRLTSIAQKDLDVRRKAHVEVLARHAVDAVPELHDALQTLRGLPSRLMTGDVVYADVAKKEK